MIRVGLIGLVVIGALALSGTPSEAHYIQTSAGKVYHSDTCVVKLKQVPNPGTHPAKVECEVTVTLLDVLCENNGGNTAPGQIPSNVVVVGENPISPGFVTDKKKGLATVPVTVVKSCGPNPAPDDPCLLGVTPAEACPNDQWSVINVLIRESTMVLKAFACFDATCTTGILTSESESTCVLPPEVTFGTVAPPQGIPQICELISNVHIN